MLVDCNQLAVHLGSSQVYCERSKWERSLKWLFAAIVNLYSSKSSFELISVDIGGKALFLVLYRPVLTYWNWGKWSRISFNPYFLVNQLRANFSYIFISLSSSWSTWLLISFSSTFYFSSPFSIVMLEWHLGLRHLY